MVGQAASVIMVCPREAGGVETGAGAGGDLLDISGVENFSHHPTTPGKSSE